MAKIYNAWRTLLKMPIEIQWHKHERVPLDAGRVLELRITEAGVMYRIVTGD